jgi:hypothetical protein
VPPVLLSLRQVRQRTHAKRSFQTNPGTTRIASRALSTNAIPSGRTVRTNESQASKTLVGTKGAAATVTDLSAAPASPQKSRRIALQQPEWLNTDRQTHEMLPGIS